MWKRGGNGIIYKVRSSALDESRLNFTKRRHSMFSPSSVFAPKNAGARRSLTGKYEKLSALPRFIVRQFDTQLHLHEGITPESRAPALDNELRHCAWRMLDAAPRHKNWWPIHHGALPNFEKLQPGNWFIVGLFDEWVCMQDLNPESVSCWCCQEG